MRRVIISLCAILLFLPMHANSANRILYEDFENTTYQEHPFEYHYGSSFQSYWDIFKSNVFQSDVSPHSGSYCLTYEALSAYDAHATIGIGPTAIGSNTSELNLADYHHQRWYFSWYQRWEEDIVWDGTNNKCLHVNQNSSNEDTSLSVTRGDSNSWHLTLYNNGNIIVNEYPSPPGTTMDDMAWHHIETYIDYGTNNSDAELVVWFDGTQLYQNAGLSMSGVDTNPVKFLNAWPGNVSGNTDPTGRSINTWLDDLEIYLVEGLSDIPSGENCSDYDGDSTNCASNGCTYCSADNTCNNSECCQDDASVCNVTDCGTYYPTYNYCPPCQVTSCSSEPTTSYILRGVTYQ